MRANPDFSKMPERLKKALIQYDDDRYDFSYEYAEVLLNHAIKTPESDLGRLFRGLRAQTTHGLIVMGKLYANVCKTYVRENTGNLRTLQGLFYWNGSDKLTERILIKAWERNL